MSAYRQFMVTVVAEDALNVHSRCSPSSAWKSIYPVPVKPSTVLGLLNRGPEAVASSASYSSQEPGGGGVGEGENGAVVRSTGSHCGGQVTPRTEGSALKIGWPMACVSSETSSCTMTPSAGKPRISLVIQVRESAELASRSTSVKLLGTLGFGTWCGSLLLVVNG